MRSRPEEDRWPDLAGRMDGGQHRLPIRVYYEDTDFSGFVYHANYLKFCERARSDWLRLLGLRHRELMRQDDGTRERGRGFVVRRLEADFLKPAVIDDLLEVVTEVVSTAGARLTLLQTVDRGDERLFLLAVTVAFVDHRGRPCRLPQQLVANLASK